LVRHTDAAALRLASRFLSEEPFVSLRSLRNHAATPFVSLRSLRNRRRALTNHAATPFVSLRSLRNR
jgi:hypothetical protein